MWRAFGAARPRVALIFSVPWYSSAALALGVQFSPVAYLSDGGAHAILDQVVVNLASERTFLAALPRAEIVQITFQMLLAAVCCSKHEIFSEEREWRGFFVSGIEKSPFC